MVMLEAEEAEEGLDALSCSSLCIGCHETCLLSWAGGSLGTRAEQETGHARAPQTHNDVSIRREKTHKRTLTEIPMSPHDQLTLR